jgi:hypothetical protein
MNLSGVDTIQELKEWVEENMPGARLTEDSAGDIVIHTGLHSTMGGYLHEREAEWWKTIVNIAAKWSGYVYVRERERVSERA